jgi:hypothetical protein
MSAAVFLILSAQHITAIEWEALRHQRSNKGMHSNSNKANIYLF